MFDKITVLGVGLIGASFASAMREKGLCNHVAGFGRSRENLERAKEKGIIDSFDMDPRRACEGSDIVLLATPVGSFLDLVAKCGDSFAKGAIITDCGSVKGALVYELEKLMPGDVHFVGGHPIAGSDRSGIDFSSPGLFKNAKCILTPTANSDPGTVRSVYGIWKALGADVLTMDPEEHDRIYAFVSHLPHIIAFSLVNTVSETDEVFLQFCGNGFKDTTRIAGSSHELWRDVCLLNKKNVADALALYQKKLDAIRQYLAAGDSASLEAEFMKARKVREGLGKN